MPVQSNWNNVLISHLNAYLPWPLQCTWLWQAERSVWCQVQWGVCTTNKKIMSTSFTSMHIFPGHSNALGYDRLKGLFGVKCSEVSVQQIKKLCPHHSSQCISSLATPMHLAMAGWKVCLVSSAAKCLYNKSKTASSFVIQTNFAIFFLYYTYHTYYL